MEMDYSQAGEVSWILKNVRLPEMGYFVDVGAHDGRTDSNTYWFEKMMGWKGLCIEPHPQMGQLLHAHRKCKIAQCAVGTQACARFFISEISSWSGTTPPKGNYHEMVVPMLRLDMVLRQASLPRVDVLSIDTEGTELDVLSTIGLDSWAVKALIVEWDSQSREDGNHENEIREYMAAYHYYDFGAKIGANLIYVRKGYQNAVQVGKSEEISVGETSGYCEAVGQGISEPKEVA
jgi:FkbM family methyltransferase